MTINIGSLINERRNGFATLAYEEGDQISEQRIRISFLKPTSQVWRDVQKIGEGTDEEKDALVAQLVRLDVQSDDIEDASDKPHKITQQDLEAIDVTQLRQLMEGVKESFFLQMQRPAQTTAAEAPAEPRAATSEKDEV